jgi:hypothetical protein
LWADPGYVRLYIQVPLNRRASDSCEIEDTTKIPMRSSALSILLATYPYHIALTVNINTLIRGIGVEMHMPTWSQSMPGVLHFGTCWVYFAVHECQKEGDTGTMALAVFWSGP